MTSFDGETPSGDTVDTIEVDGADTEVDSEAVSTDEDAVPAEVTDAAAVADEDEDPAVALKKELRLKPGEWYVIHSYAGYENKVKANLETRVQNL
ncbi:MAG: transcription termination/antitermination protein NusG, partial [Mycobacterium sp.]|nr:transcription termination/antitermination protein NusG [Mycobacterium sp.]